MKKDIVIVDIDGTIAKVGERLKYLQKEPKDWDSFYEHCDEDEPIADIVRVVKDLYFCGYNIVFCTGRRESVRNKTIEWIKKHLGFESWHYRLLMREDNDWRHDTIVKPLMLDFPASEVLFVLEDRNSMVKRWRELGYTCLQVNDGDF